MSCSSCGKKSDGLVIPTIGQAVHGLKSIVGMASPDNRVMQPLIDERRNHCRNCEHATKNPKFLDKPSKGLTSVSQCRKCSCLIALKTMSAQEKCPLGKW